MEPSPPEPWQRGSASFEPEELGREENPRGSVDIFIYIYIYIWVFPKIIGVPQNGWFIMKNLIKLDDLGIPLFLETSIFT